MKNTTLVIIAAVGMMIGSNGFAATKACEKETLMKQMREVCTETIEAMRTAALSTKDQRQADLKSDVRVVFTDENPAYTAILNVFNKEKNTHVQLWAVTECLAVGPRHAVFEPGKVGATLTGKSVIADVGYRNSQSFGFAEKRTLTPLACGSGNAQDGKVSEDICLYKATSKFPSTVKPIRILSAKANSDLELLNKKSLLEGVGFTNAASKLNGNKLTLGSSKVSESISGSFNGFFQAVYTGLSGSGLLAKSPQSGELSLAGFKVSDIEIISGKRIENFVAAAEEALPESSLECQ